MKKIFEKKKGMALSQIIILILGIIAIAYALGSEIREVKAFAIPGGTGPGLITYAEEFIASTRPIPVAGGTFFKNFLKGLLRGGAGGGAERAAREGGRYLTAKQIATRTSFWQGLGSVVGSAMAAAGAAVLIYEIARLAGASERNLRNIAFSGTIAATGTFALANIIAFAALGTGPPGWLVAGITAIATVLISSLSFQTYSREIFSYQPSLWQPADGGQRCEECNALKFGCDEYQCHSYGRACVLANQGSNFETCMWNNSLDRTPPVMDAMESVLSDNWVYIDSGVTLPPELGVKINNPGTNEGCVPPYSSVTLGVNTSEQAECKIDKERRANYGEMISFMDEGSALTYNHMLVLPNSATPSADAMEYVGWNTENGMHQEFYIRCKDANGNVAPANFIIEFCVDDSPDREPPQILGTNYLEPAYIGHGQQTASLEVYTDEPATCRWSHEDNDYDSMGNEMADCSQELGDYLKENSYTYGCSGELTGIDDNADNVFYIRCKDKPWLAGTEDEGNRYKSTISEKLTLIGTSPLVINNIKVNGQQSNILIKDSAEEVKIKIEVETYAGAENGLARCKYIIDGDKNNFYNDGSPEYLPKNTQTLWLTEAHYQYNIECTDIAGNSDNKEIEFDVETDFEAPKIIRAYNEGSSLKIITSEPAECVYGTTSCSYDFDDGIKMTSSNDITHSVAWDTRNNLYIKCQDEYENGGEFNDCSKVIRPFEFF